MIHIDVLFEIFSWLSFEKRLELADCNENAHTVAQKWCDIHELIVNEGNLIFISRKLQQIMKYENKQTLQDILQTFFELCLSIQSVYIQFEMKQADIEIIKTYLPKIKNFHLSASNFHRNRKLIFEDLKLSSLQCLRILQPSDENVSTAPELKLQHVATLFPQTLSHIVLSGVAVYPSMFGHMIHLPHLRVLDLKGSITDTKKTISQLTTLSTSKSLVELHLPPSLFSFSDRKFFPDVSPIDLRKTKLKTLSVYVHKYNEPFFWQQMETLIPKTLEKFILYGNHTKLKDCHRFMNWEKREIVQFETQTSRIEDKCWPRITIKLIDSFIFPVQTETWQNSLDQRDSENTQDRDALNQIILRRRNLQRRNRAGRNEQENMIVDMDIEDDLTTPPSTPSPNVSPIIDRRE